MTWMVMNVDLPLASSPQSRKTRCETGSARASNDLCYDKSEGQQTSDDIWRAIDSHVGNQILCTNSAESQNNLQYLAIMVQMENHILEWKTRASWRELNPSMQGSGNFTTSAGTPTSTAQQRSIAPGDWYSGDRCRFALILPRVCTSVFDLIWTYEPWTP